MKLHLKIATLVCASLVTYAFAPLACGQQEALLAGAKQLKLDTCFVTLIDDVDVPARETGPLVELIVKEGQAIRQGDLLGKSDDQIVQRKLQEATAKLRAAEKKANSTVEIEYAEAASDFATKEYEINRNLREKNAISLPEFQKSALAKKQAELSIAKTRNDLEIEHLNADALRVEHDAVNDALVRHQITSPLDGNVLEIYKQSGEWVQAGDKVLRIVRMNRLRVQGFIEAANFDPHEVDGRQVIAKAKLAHGREESFSGRVASVGLETHGGSQTSGGSRYSIWVEVENKSENDHWLLSPGAEVDLTIDLVTPAVALTPSITESR